MKITEETTRFIFRDYTDNELSILRKLISANDEHFLYEDEDWVACPIGVENYIKRKFPDAKIEKNPPWPSTTIKYKLKDEIAARDKLQKDAMKFLREYKDRPQLGLICATGQGKTVMAIKHAFAVGEKTLIICPTTAILLQWVDTLQNMFHVPTGRFLHINGTSKLSQMSGNYDFVLVLEQTLQGLIRNNKLEPLLKNCKFGLKIIDEIHMFLRNNIAIDCCSNIKRTLYLTGTFFRTQEEESNLFNAIYHDILRFEVVKQSELEKYGQKKHINVLAAVIDSKLTRKEVSRIVIKAKIGRKSVNTVSIGRYMQIVCPDDGKVTPYMKQSLAIVKRMHDQVEYGRMLVLVPSIFATKQFRKLIAQMYPKLKVGSINSEQSRALNTRVKEEADIVVSTSKSAGVGFDMKDLSVLIAVEQFRSPVLVDQISGRLRARPDGKDTFYVDIADKALGLYLLKWRSERLARLKEKAKSYKQITVS